MASWRCPHCGSPQREAAECWVCRRSTVSCGSCRHFRKSVAGQLGYCAHDLKRLPLTGLEERACWERAAAENAAADAPADNAAAAAAPQADASVGGGLWGILSTPGVEPDRPAGGHGLWAEPDVVRNREPARDQHGGSIRSRPWGPVPGRQDSPAGLRAIKSLTTKR